MNVVYFIDIITFEFLWLLIVWRDFKVKHFIFIFAKNALFLFLSQSLNRWIIMSILQHTKPNTSLERLTTLVLENMVIRLIDSFTMMFDRSKSGILTSHKDGIFASFSTRSITTTKKANRKDNADKDWD